MNFNLDWQRLYQLLRIWRAAQELCMSLRLLYDDEGKPKPNDDGSLDVVYAVLYQNWQNLRHAVWFNDNDGD